VKYGFFRISVVDPGAAAQALNRFLAEHRVVNVDRQFVADGADSFWAFSVAYVDSAAPAAGVPVREADAPRTLAGRPPISFNGGRP